MSAELWALGNSLGVVFAMLIFGDSCLEGTSVGSLFTGVLFPPVVGGNDGWRWKLLSGQHVRTEIEIVIGDAASCTIYSWKVTGLDSEGVFTLSPESEGKMFVNKGSTSADSSSAMQVISLCAGMGGCIEGSKAAGFKTMAACDKSDLATTFLRRNYNIEVIGGDFSDEEIVKGLHHAKTDGLPWLEAGFPCQPYSRLGDQKAWQDDRARTFEHVLRVGWLLQVRGLILECVVAAGQCVELRKLLQDFADVMGLKVIDGPLTLDRFWPSRRTRWWALLVPCSWECGSLRDMPKSQSKNSVASLITWWPAWPLEEERQLAWAEHEQHALKDPRYGPINRRLDMSQPAPTALHSLGNHFSKCPCGCRAGPFKEARLLSGGIHCTEIISQWEGNVSRYFHPQELGVLMGFLASYDYGDDMRAALCLLGQVAAPMQACWAFAQLGQLIAKNLADSPFSLLPDEELSVILLMHSEAIRSSMIAYWPRLDTLQASRPCLIHFADSTTLSLTLGASASCLDFLQAQSKLDKEEFEFQLMDGSDLLQPHANLDSTHYGCNKRPRRDAPKPHSDAVEVTFCLDESRIVVPGKSGDFLFQFLQHQNLSHGSICHVGDTKILDLDLPIWESCTLVVKSLVHGGGCKTQATLNDMMKDFNMRTWLEARRAQADSIVADKGVDDVTITYAARFLCRRAALSDLLVIEPMEVLQWLEMEEEAVLDSVRNALKDFDGTRIVVLLGSDDHWALLDYAISSDGGEATYIDGLDARLQKEAWQIGLWIHQTFGNGPFNFVAASAFWQQGGSACGAIMLLHLGWRLNLWSEFSKHDVAAWYSVLVWGVIRPCFFGGGGPAGSTEDPLRQWLREFLIGKGVEEEAVDGRIEKALKTFSRSKIEQALKQKNPWQALKALGSSQPKPFIWLSYNELQSQIQQRGESKWGADLDVQKRSKRKPKASQSPIDQIIDPGQLVIPKGHFLDGDAPLPQLGHADLRSGARGVVILKFGDAMPFLKDGKSISTECLMMLILGKHDLNLICGLSFRFITLPVHYASTGEPVLVPCTAVQIGDGMITEAQQGECPEVDTLPTAVVRFHVYRDEWPDQWAALASKPLKSLIDRTPLLQLCRMTTCKQDCGRTHLAVEEQGAESVVLDVWGWKWSTAEGKKVRPAEAALLQAYMRCPESVEGPLQGQSGYYGAYFEPRQNDGPGPSQEFAVVWVPGADLQQVLHLAKTHDAVRGVARINQRYGVKVREKDHEEVHLELCPNRPFMRGHLTAVYRIEPLPVGTHRQAISDLLSKWSWEAKPLQAARSSRGQAWEIGATSPPPTDFFQHSDGYVTATLVKDLEHKPQPNTFVVPAKTRSAIHQEAKHEPKTEVQKADPWLQAGDPWADFYARKNKSTGPMIHGAAIPLPPTSAPTASKLEEVENKITNGVQKSVQSELGALESKLAAAHNQRFQKIETDLIELQQQGRRFEDWFAKEGLATEQQAAQLQSLEKQVTQQAATTQQLVASFEDCTTQIQTNQQALLRVAGEVHSVKGAVEQSMERYFAQQTQQIQSMLQNRAETPIETESKRAKCHPSPRD